MAARAHPFKVVALVEREATASPAVPPKRDRRWLGAAVREPFVHFVLLGLLIWAASAYWSAHQSRYLIEVGPADRQRIATNYLRQFGQLPTANQLQKLLDRYVREEIYLREGRALNLDQDDEIVRRRIVQKYEFLQTDLAVADIPTKLVLQRWFEQNKARYLIPERVAFSHVYFSVDHDGEAAAKERAVKTLAKLRATHVSRAAEQGDSFPGPSDVSSLVPDEASRLLGESELTQTLFKLPANQWSGPYRSGYGWHLIYVTGKMPPTLPAFQEVQNRVLADYQDEQRRQMNTRAFEKLRAKYIVRDDQAGRSLIVPPSSSAPSKPPTR